MRSTGDVVLPVPSLSAVAAGAAAALEETREAVSVVWPERNETDMLIVLLLHGDPDEVGREFSESEEVELVRLLARSQILIVLGPF